MVMCLSPTWQQRECCEKGGACVQQWVSCLGWNFQQRVCCGRMQCVCGNGYRALDELAEACSACAELGIVVV